MADILLRGFEMPTDASLWLLIRTDGTAHKLKVGGKHGEPQQGVAVPIPDGHGRLGDLDALINNIGDVPYKGAVRRVLMSAPTIVPAEGGTDECSKN